MAFFQNTGRDRGSAKWPSLTGTGPASMSMSGSCRCHTKPEYCARNKGGPKLDTNVSHSEMSMSWPSSPIAHCSAKAQTTAPNAKVPVWKAAW